jgi:hypothetical protein
MTSTEEPAREFLRHTVATLAYRGGKAVRGASPETAAFRAGPSTRTPGQILAHVNDLLDWACSLAKGQHSFRESAPSSWEDGTARFFEALRRFDEVLSSNAPLGFPAEKLFQGPVADALTHVGQIALLRRLAGVPVKGENYFLADIAAGRTGPEQAAPRKEFE